MEGEKQAFANEQKKVSEDRYGGHGDPRFYQIVDEIARLHSMKNQDYAKGGEQGHLGNFYRSSAIKKLYPNFDWTTPFGTAIDYMLKQLDAALILASTQRESVTGEDIPTRLKDVGVYSLIAAILWSDSRTLKLVEEQINKWKTQQNISEYGMPTK